MRNLWTLCTGGTVPSPLPWGIAHRAAVHRVTAPLYRAMGEARCSTVSQADRSLLRASAGYNSARAERFVEQLSAAARSLDIDWCCWKGAALLIVVPGYHRIFEAADIDVMVKRSGAGELIRVLRSLGGRPTKDHRDPVSGLGTLQVVGPHRHDIRAVWDVQVVETLPDATLHDGVPVVGFHRQSDLMLSHLTKHQRVDRIRMRMFLDARIVGADWAEERCAAWLAGVKGAEGAYHV